MPVGVLREPGKAITKDYRKFQRRSVNRSLPERVDLQPRLSFSVKSESKLRSFSWAIQLNEKKVFHLNRIIFI
jgi:hypothetical protein